MSEIIKNIAQLHEKIATTKTHFIKLHLESGTTDVLGSKIMGIPYWEEGVDYPVDESGEKMKLFAQINFADMPALQHYPTSGILQWFMSINSDVYGCDFDEGGDQTNYRVVFWENPVLEKSVEIIVDNFDEYALPTDKPKRITFTKGHEFCGLQDYRSEFLYSQELRDKIDDEESVASEVMDTLYTMNNGHKIGGYATSTQEDPRYSLAKEDNWLLLLQIDTDEDIMWGDSGVGHLFIKEADLLKKDFSKVFYSWDCC